MAHFSTFVQELKMQSTIKIRASCACYTRLRGQKYSKNFTQSGVTLIELMVGIAIGLMVVAVAMGALMVSRSVSGTVSDASDIQQQAAYAMRVIGAQVRQAGSLRINLDYQPNTAEPHLAKVAIETNAAASGGVGKDFDPSRDTIRGAAASMTVGYRRYVETVTNPVKPSTPEETLARNCVGSPGDANDQRLESAFVYNATNATLSCGDGTAAQPIIQNVANFEVRYMLQDNSTSGDSKIKRVLAADVPATDWSKVQGIEVCLVLYGNEAIDMPSPSYYTDCDDKTKDMTALTGARARRMHLVFRNVFQLRSQALM